MRELTIDSFAGGGGTSEGIKAALGIDPDIAVNHDRFALAMHRINHPGTRHLEEDVSALIARRMCAGQPIGMLWMSPDCTDHSKAKSIASDCKMGMATGEERGAIAFSKTGDSQLVEWQDAVILGRYGDVPDDLAPYTSD